MSDPYPFDGRYVLKFPAHGLEIWHLGIKLTHEQALEIVMEAYERLRQEPREIA